jgi:predicted NBD/HSP70 family sugar kinase
MRNQGKNLTNVKTDNRSLVLKLLCTGQSQSRIEIAEKTGLSKMTISNIVQDLIDNHYIYEGYQNNVRKPGRKPVMLHVNEKTNRSIGIYISRSQLVVSLVSLKAKIVRSTSCTFSNIETENTLMRKMLTCIKEIVSDHELKEVLGIGVAVIGPIDIKKGILLSPLEFFGIKNFRLKEILSKKTGLSVTVNTDMNAAALAELWYGYGMTHDSFIYLGITHGVGSAIVIDGNLHLGGDGFAGEIGHMSIDHKGPSCSCGGRGCLEVYASMPVFLKKARDITQNSQDSVLAGIKFLTFKEIAEQAKNHDALAQRLMDEFIEQVGTALIGAVHLLDSTAIIIGHESALGGDWLASMLQDYINQRCMFRDILPVSVKISEFKDMGSIIGSAVLVLQPLFHRIP